MPDSFVQKIWDVLHEYPIGTSLPDVDVVCFNPVNIDEQAEKEMEARLKEIFPLMSPGL